MAKSTLKKIKKPSLSKEKKKAWALFSQYIRLKYADSAGMVKCVTCGVIKHYKEMQASHLVAGRSAGILFDERGVYPACYGCNIMKHGNILSYIDFMEELHGKESAWEIIYDLKRKSKSPTKLTVFHYQELQQKYKELLESAGA